MFQNPQQQALYTALQKLRRLGIQQGRKQPLRPLEANILETIACNCGENGELPPSRVSAWLRVQPPTISPVISQLEKDGYITRRQSPQDRRMTYISLTSKGEHSIQDIMAEKAKMIDGLVAYLGEDDTRQAIHLLEKSVEYLETQLEKGGRENG